MERKWDKHGYRHYDFSKMDMPICNECGKKMRMFKKTKIHFWSCDCKYTNWRRYKVYKKDIPTTIKIEDWYEAEKKFPEVVKHKKISEDWYEEFDNITKLFKKCINNYDPWIDLLEETIREMDENKTFKDSSFFNRKWYHNMFSDNWRYSKEFMIEVGYYEDDKRHRNYWKIKNRIITNLMKGTYVYMVLHGFDWQEKGDKKK